MSCKVRLFGAVLTLFLAALSIARADARKTSDHFPRLDLHAPPERAANFPGRQMDRL